LVLRGFLLWHFSVRALIAKKLSNVKSHRGVVLGLPIANRNKTTLCNAYSATSSEICRQGGFMVRKSILSSFLLGISLLIGCNTTESDWAKAKNDNTASAYSEFVERHRQGPHVDEAIALIESMDWDAAKNTNTVPAYQAFISKHPTGRFAETARTELRDLRWAEAKRLMTREAFAAFLKDYPSSPYTDEANARISALGLTRAGSVQIFEGYGAMTCSTNFTSRIGSNGEIGTPRDGSEIQVVVFRDIPEWRAEEAKANGLDIKPGAAYLRWNRKLLYIRDLSPEVLRSDSKVCGQFIKK